MTVRFEAPLHGPISDALTTMPRRAMELRNVSTTSPRSSMMVPPTSSTTNRIRSTRGAAANGAATATVRTLSECLRDSCNLVLSQITRLRTAAAATGFSRSHLPGSWYSTLASPTIKLWFGTSTRHSPVAVCTLVAGHFESVGRLLTCAGFESPLQAGYKTRHRLQTCSTFSRRLLARCARAARIECSGVFNCREMANHVFKTTTNRRRGDPPARTQDESFDDTCLGLESR